MAETPSILLADDNIDDQAFLRDAFNFINAEVNLLIFDNGKDAIDFLQSVPVHNYPHLIVLDYNMPELNGIEVLNILNKEEKLRHIPKVILSTSKIIYPNIEVLVSPNAYLIKPDNVFDLKQLASDLLGFIGVSQN